MRLVTSILSVVGIATAFSPERTTNYGNFNSLPTTTRLFSSVPSDVSSASLTLADLKADLVSTCTKENKPSLKDIQMLVRDLEEKAEMVGEGQSSSITGIMGGEWYVWSLSLESMMV